MTRASRRRPRGRCLDAALALTESAARTDFRGPDPFDALWWRWPAPLVGGRRRRQALSAARPLAGRHAPAVPAPPPADPEGAGGLRLRRARAHRLTGAAAPRELGCAPLELLDADRGAGPRAGATRGTCRRAGASIRPAAPTWSSPRSRRAGCWRRRGAGSATSSRAREAARWVLRRPVIEPEGYFAYHPGRPVNIHNANLLGAWLVDVAGPGPRARERVERAVERTLAAQRPDGSWPYGEGGNLGWADSFHSGYVLICLDRLRAVDRRSTRRCSAARRTTGGSSTPLAARGSGRQAVPGGRALGGNRPDDSGRAAAPRTGRRELIERVARRVLDQACATGTLCTGATAGAPRRALRALVRRPRRAGLVDAAAALRGGEDLAPRAAAAQARRSSWARSRPAARPIGPPCGTSLKSPPTLAVTSTRSP